MDNPEFLEFLTEVGSSEMLVRIARETAEDDLIESINGDQFRAWKEAQYDRLVRAALVKTLQKPFREPGVDPAIILLPGDLQD
ncbi:hypothetical protein [Allosphingosinicella vermicomposti]|uniref:hypothetical protein n=1 Tax=Allosphingosinicella vermicomposti TaxID=614671 RepID=UPI000D0FB4B7|nr:hypothetical protein [Allosphingosinicella vermicomposti]